MAKNFDGNPFAPGFTVFPGGGVDPEDWSAKTTAPEPWLAQFEDEPERVTALGRAATRELFEECGVLLAAGGRTPDRSRALAARERIAAKELTFTDYLTQEGAETAIGLLRPMAHWITPAEEPRRFDTRFFLAVLPEGQEADGHTSESAQSLWRKPAHALDPASPQPCLLLPPTWTLLRQLAAHERVEDVVAELDARRGPIPAIMPENTAQDGGFRWNFPDSDEYQAWTQALASR